MNNVQTLDMLKLYMLITFYYFICIHSFVWLKIQRDLHL